MKTINNNTLETIILSENEMNMVSAGTGFNPIDYMLGCIKSLTCGVAFGSHGWL